MPVIVRKNQYGELEGQVRGTNPRPIILIGKGFRFFHGRKTNYLHFFSKSYEKFLIVVDRLSITMLYDKDEFAENDRFWMDYESYLYRNSDSPYDEDGDDKPNHIDSTDTGIVHWEHPLILHVPMRNKPALTDLNGYIKSGSNTWSYDGSLCLGESYCPTSVHPLELLAGGEPNDDLQWYGGPLEGLMNEERELNANSWPSHHHQLVVPQEIRAAISHYWG